jgi:uncharacterized membrane protein
MNKELLIYIIVYIVVTGLWGFITKFTSLHLNWKTNLAFVWMTAFIIHAITIYDGIDFHITKWHLLAMVAGILAACGTVIMYKMIDKFDIITIRPLMEFNIIITLFLAYFFIGESFTFQRIVGVIFAILSLILLTR